MLVHLDRSKITIFALSLADAGEFGLVRLIVSDPERASKILEDADFILAKSRKNTEVSAILLGENDKISKVTKILGDNRINIDYAYSSAILRGNKLALILRIGDTKRAETILKENYVTVLSLDELKHHFQ